jgi:hypothetical protein
VTVYDKNLQPHTYKENCYQGDLIKDFTNGFNPPWAHLFTSAAAKLLAEVPEEYASLKSGGHPNRAYRMITGKKATWIHLSQIDSLNFLDDYELKEKDCAAIMVDTKGDDGGVKDVGLVPSHAYALLSFSRGMVTLFNPWGAFASSVTAWGAHPVGDRKGLFTIPEETLRKYFLTLYVPCHILPPHWAAAQADCQ